MRIILRTTGLCFFLLVSLHALHIADAARWMGQDPLPYWVHACVQLFVEMSLCTAIGWWMQRRGLLWTTALWLTGVLWWTILHLMDIHMVRLMDISLVHAAQSTYEEGWDNFVEILKASNVSLALYSGLMALAATLSGLTLWAYQRALHRETKASRSPTPGLGIWTGLACLSLLGASALMDCTGADPSSLSGGQKLNRALPWKHRMVELQQDSRIPLCPHEGSWRLLGGKASHLQKHPLQLNERPPILLFVIESLHADMVNGSTAPFLTAFGKQHFASKSSYANANATPLSWLAILTGFQPARWGSAAIASMTGSPALQALQQAGYSLHVHTASRLSYYNMETKLFGKQHRMLSSYFESPPDLPLEAWQRDSAVLENLRQSLQAGNTEGHFHIVFLEGTHFGYSWPEEQTIDQPICTPAAGAIAFWDPQQLTGLKNRYTNSIRHMDQKLAAFFQDLQSLGLYDSSQIVITADHGEEFFEHGHLFHASALDEEQVHVPLFWKLSGLDDEKCSRERIVSHVDILPTLLHSLTGSERASSALDGHSIMSPHHPDSAISWRYNFQAPPHEFSIHTPQAILRASLDQPLQAHRAQQAIVEFASCEGACVSTTQILRDPQIKQVLDRFFNRERPATLGQCTP